MSARVARRGPVLAAAAALACLVSLALGWHDPVRAGPRADQAGGGAGAGPDLAAGRQLYVVHCSSCHGLNVQGTASGPELVDVGAASADFYLRTGRMPLNDPRQQPTRHSPAFPDPQIRQLVDYIASLGSGQPIPVLMPGNVAAGNELFQLDCAQCHNVAGAGGALGYGDIVPSVNHATAAEVAEAIRVGPRPMPVFGPGNLSDQQVSDVAAYVQYLHHPDDRGGFGLGHLGPIPEGFVGWVVGLGLLLLVTRLIGTRG